MSERYKVLEKSESFHCCFEATVIDTKTPDILTSKSGETAIIKDYSHVCECFDIKHAQMIADLLNKAYNYD